MKTKKLSSIIICLLFATAMQAQTSGKFQQVIFQTNGKCQSCKNKIESNISYEKGVKEVNYDLATSKVCITYNVKKTDPQKLQAAIRALGYTAEPDSKDCQKSCSGSCGGNCGGCKQNDASHNGEKKSCCGGHK
ncbi:MAG: heavy-metal-associated domain-containing protein [Bacteroidales bacterium]|nr:heavy-metal-associated domain-containing protein [Bacteroidales bacterium]